PENQGCDSAGEGRINPAVSGKVDGNTAHDDGSGRKSIAHHMNEGAANIYIMASAMEHGGDESIHQHAQASYPHHELRIDCDRILQTVDCLDKYKNRNNLQH